MAVSAGAGIGRGDKEMVEKVFARQVRHLGDRSNFDLELIAVIDPVTVTAADVGMNAASAFDPLPLNISRASRNRLVCPNDFC
ncbi:MAG: hypothetical protein ACLQU2_05635 [Candidatus Binataceae bacterium]